MFQLLTNNIRVSSHWLQNCWEIGCYHQRRHLRQEGR